MDESERNFSLLGLCVRTDCFSKILQFLDGSDLLRLSEVSSGWYSFIAQSSQAMDKIQVVIDDNWDREFVFEVVEASHRRYKHLKIVNLLRTREHVKRLIFKNSSSLCSIDSYFDFKLNGLQLWSVKSLAFRQRERTTVMRSASVFDDGFLSVCNMLTKLEIAGQTHSSDAIINCLRSNKQLEELVMDANAASEFISYYRPQTRFPFKLKTLKLGAAGFMGLGSDLKLLDFLSSQAETIQTLKVIHCGIDLLYHIFKTMDNMECLTFSLEFNNEYRSDFRIQQKLKDLRLIEVRYSLSEAILAAAPNLEKLYMSRPTVYLVQHVLFNVPSLREFSFAAIVDPNHDFSAQDVINFVQREKAKPTSDINRNLHKISQI